MGKHWHVICISNNYTKANNVIAINVILKNYVTRIKRICNIMHVSFLLERNINMHKLCHC